MDREKSRAMKVLPTPLSPYSWATASRGMTRSISQAGFGSARISSTVILWAREKCWAISGIVAGFALLDSIVRIALNFFGSDFGHGCFLTLLAVAAGFLLGVCPLTLPGLEIPRPIV